MHESPGEEIGGQTEIWNVPAGIILSLVTVRKAHVY